MMPTRAGGQNFIPFQTHNHHICALFAFVGWRMHTEAHHFAGHAYTPSDTANHHMLDTQIPLYNEGRPERKEETSRTLLPLGPGRCPRGGTQQDLSSSRKCI